MPRSETVIRNDNYRNPVTIITEEPDLDEFGAAGARLKMDRLLSKPEGATPQELRGLSAVERTVLRAMAEGPDPQFGVPRQAAAIGLLGELVDRDALLQLAEQSRNRDEDRRVRAAATASLGKIGGPGVAPVLRELLQQADVPAVQMQAAWGLAQVGELEDIAAVAVASRSADQSVADVASQAGAALRLRLGSVT